MTSSLPHKSRPHGFTLIEILVVVGIIVLLATIALPMMSRAYSQAKRTQMAADLSVISQALEAYRADFGDYPRHSPDITGASLLCWALVAPGGKGDGLGNPPGTDGNEGPGFRIRGTTGTVKGPYLPVDRFTIGTIAPPGMASSPVQVLPATTFDNRADVLSDRYYHPILYFPANKGADPTSKHVPAGAYVNSGDFSPLALYNFIDTHGSTFAPTGYGIDQPPNRLTPKVMAYRLGNIDGSGTLAASDTPSGLGPYLLWAPGPDGYYGTEDDVVDNGHAIQLNTAKIPSNFP